MMGQFTINDRLERARAEDEMSPDAVRALREISDLSDEERMDVFRLFCRECGSDDKDCQCWNDE